MKEYGIYQRCKSGKPYMVLKFNSIMQCKVALYDMVQLEEERGRPYFVDNDFFDNKYVNSFNGMYYCIKVREVTDYEVYKEKEEHKNNNDKNNLIFFQDYIDKYK